MATSRELKAILENQLKGTNISMADDEVYNEGRYLTGVLPIDIATGGGLAKGRFILTMGESATLKSYIGLSTIAQVQKAGGTAALIDAEHSFNSRWATDIGIDTSELLVSRPSTGEEAVDQMEVLVRNGVDFICLDSIAALLPKSEMQTMLSGKDNVQPARIAALMSLAMRKLTSANLHSTIFMITQMRANIGGMAFSPKTLATGGKSMVFYASQILEIKRTGRVFENVQYYNGEKDESDKQIIGNKFRVEVTKSRIDQPFKIQHFNYDLKNSCVDNIGFIIAQGLDMGLITRKGAWWTLNVVNFETGEVEEHKQGSKDKFYDYMLESPECQSYLFDAICQKYELENVYQ